MRWWPASLRGRLSLSAALLAGLLLVAGTLLVSADVTRTIGATIDHELRDRLDVVKAGVSAGALDVVVADTFAQVTTADGAVVKSSFGEGKPAVLTAGEQQRALDSRVVVVNRAAAGVGPRTRLLAEPIVVGGRTEVVVVGATTEPLERARQRARLTLAVLMPIVVLALGLGAWVLVGAVLRPVTRLTDEAARLSMDDPSRRLPEPTGDHEVAVLGRHLNTLLDRVQAAMATDRAFVDDASHELRTPISVLRGEVELAQLALADARSDPSHLDVSRLDAVGESLAAARDETERLSRLADDLLVLARMDQGQVRLRKEAVHPRQLAEAVVARLGPGRTRVDVVGDDVLVNADAARIEQVLTNLVANARRHAFSKVLIAVEDLGSDGASVTVADDGKGFPVDLLPVAFERFRRANPARTGRAPGREGGTGLGLAIVSAIVASHRGDISASNGPPLGGAAVRVRLP